MMLLYVYLLGLAVSIITISYDLILEKLYRNFSEYLKLVVFAAFEAIIYHPLIVIFTLRGYIQYLTRSNFKWGQMTRQGFSPSNNANTVKTMLKRLTYFRLLIVIFGSLYGSQTIYAQLAGTTNERNEEASRINERYKQGKWEEGKKLAEEFLRKNPKDSDMRMLVGKYHLHHQQYEQARYELVKCLMYAPASVDAKHMLVAVETETQRYSSAICYINELLEVNPYWKGLWRKKIDLYRKMGNQVEADRLLKRIVQIYPEDGDLNKDQSYILDQRLADVKKSGKIDETIQMSKN